MPNWCNNNVVLKAPSESEADRLMEVLCSDKPKLLGFVEPIDPMPEEAKSEGLNSYCRRVWGTKWEPEIYFYELTEPTVIEIQMSSAWSPPTIAFAKFVEKGWKVKAVYSETANCFCGIFSTNEEGEISLKDYELDFSNKDWREIIPEDITAGCSLEEEYESWKEMQAEYEEENCAG